MKYLKADYCKKLGVAYYRKNDIKKNEEYLINARTEIENLINNHKKLIS